MVEVDINDLKRELELASKISNNGGSIDEVKKELEREKIEEAEKNLLKEWKESKNKRIIIDHNHFKTAEHLLNTTIKGYSNCTILFGEGGIGKTHLTFEVIKKHFKGKNDDWEYKAGFTTPLAFYRWLYENRNKDLLVLDDVEGLFSNAKTIAMLKSMLWESNGKRIISYDTSWKNAEDLPSTFEIKARFVILANDIPKRHNPHIEALLSRVVSYSFNIGFKDKMNIIFKILDDKDLSLDKKEKCKSILNKVVTETTQNLNFRTLERLISLVCYNKSKAERLFKETIEIDEDLSLVLKLVKSGLGVKEQVTQFIERTGKSRATYFRIKTKVSKSH
tara:strand:- start:1188 stop:2192 length:1005 start_codon:yes stop_codon:yes gene_type:complete